MTDDPNKRWGDMPSTLNTFYCGREEVDVKEGEMRGICWGFGI